MAVKEQRKLETDTPTERQTGSEAVRGCVSR